MEKRQLRGLTAVLLTFLAHTSAVACLCVPTRSASAEFGACGYVVAGRVLDMKLEMVDSLLGVVFRVHMNVTQAWKGATSGDFVVTTAGNEAGCGYPFRVDTVYLVYASVWNGTVFTSICNRTRKLSEAQEDLQFLKTVFADGKRESTPLTFLLQNYPNPFNPRTEILYTLTESGHVSLTIVTLCGETIRVLMEGQQAAGSHQTSWDGENDYGVPLPGGVYLCRLNTVRAMHMRKMLLLR